jgi:hypothetical protein
MSTHLRRASADTSTDPTKRDVHCEDDADQNSCDDDGADERDAGLQRIAPVSLRTHESQTQHQYADDEDQQHRDTTAESETDLGLECPPQVFRAIRSDDRSRYRDRGLCSSGPAFTRRERQTAIQSDDSTGGRPTDPRRIAQSRLVAKGETLSVSRVPRAAGRARPARRLKSCPGYYKRPPETGIFGRRREPVACRAFAAPIFGSPPPAT